MSTLKDRLAALWPNDSIAGIAEKIGMSPMGLSKVFNKNSLPKADTLLKINELSGCDLKWLMTGEGVPFPNESEKQFREKEVPIEGGLPDVLDALGNPVDIDEFVFIPRYNVKAAAGHGYANSDHKSTLRMAFRKFWIDNLLRARPADLSVISVKGDSMTGVLEDGDNILVNHAQNRPGNGLYVVRIGEDLVVKRVQAMPGGKLLFSSANEAYAPFEVDLKDESSDVQVIGRVEWFGRQI